MHKIASKHNPIQILFKFSSFDAWTCPCGIVYYRNHEVMEDLELVNHEDIHLNQIKKDGAIKFSIKYAYYSLRYGYINNPYEIEARKG